MLFFNIRPTTYTAHVIMEIFTTEKTYVGDLTDIIQVGNFMMCVTFNVYFRMTRSKNYFLKMC